MIEWRRKVRPVAITPEMNVTPLVDVVLVLLIIFMVVAPRMDQDVQVELPGIFNPDPEMETSLDPLKVTVAKGNEFYINDQKYDLETAIEVMSSEHASEPLRRLVLRADSGLTYGQVREIFARSQKVGFPGMALMVGERHRPGAQPADAADATEGGVADSARSEHGASTPEDAADAPRPADDASADGATTGGKTDRLGG